MGLFNQGVAGLQILNASNDLTSWPKQETGTPQETNLARVYLMSQNILLSDGAFLRGGSYFNCWIIVWELQRVECFPLHHQPSQQQSCFCTASPSARQNCCLPTRPGYGATMHVPSRQLRPWDGLQHSCLRFSVHFPCFQDWGRGPIFLVFVSVVFHMSSQRNKWEIGVVCESEINPVWKPT